MDLKQLEYIIKIAEENNITHAAEKLFITQSALNQQLLKLEKELGTPLFYRSRTDWRPTPAGEVYLEAAKRILLIKQEAYSKIYDMTQAQKGSLSVGFTPGRGIAMFSHVYPEFHNAYPHIQVTPNELSVHAQQSMLLSGNLDLGFMTLLECQQKTGLEYTKIATEELILAMPASKAASYPCSLQSDSIFPEFDLTLLRDEPFVLTHKTSTIRELTDRIFSEAGFSPNVLFETANNQTIISMIQAGICCGILPMYYVDQTDPSIAYFTLASHPVWEVAAAYRKDHYISKAAREFISLAARYFISRLMP